MLMSADGSITIREEKSQNIDGRPTKNYGPPTETHGAATLRLPPRARIGRQARTMRSRSLKFFFILPNYL
ncbi:MAG: hypothetical protein AVO39_07970 [delta proteobacterium MLS_D]|nr:MAG: hypothetical protein AVO39_07970 [delta proteobacterium MLS_D]